MRSQGPSLPEIRRLVTRARLRWRDPASTEIDRSAFESRMWRAAAEELGLRCEPLGESFFELHSATRRLRVHAGRLPVDDPVTVALSRSKPASRILLRRAGVPTPETTTVRDPRDVAGLRSLERFGTVVVKPATWSGGGAGVTTGVSGRHDLRAAVREALALDAEAAIEPTATGDVDRVLVFDGVVIDAVRRAPATVTADGRRCIRVLVRDENARRKAAMPDETAFIPYTLDLRIAVRSQGFSLRDAPAPGLEIVVSGRSNTGALADSRSIMSTLRTDVSDLAIAAADAIGVRLAGVDVVSSAGEPPIVLEVNTTPGLHWHYLVADPPGGTDVAQIILAGLLGC